MCNNFVCFNESTRKCFTSIIFQIIYIIVICVLLIFLIINTIIVGLNLPKINLIFYLILFFLNIICIILVGILICYSRRTIDTNLQKKIKALCITALIITISILVLTIVEEIIISIDFSKNNKASCVMDDLSNPFKISDNIDRLENTPVEDNVTDCIDSYLNKSIQGFSYFTITMMELISIVAICFWAQCKIEFTSRPLPQANTIGPYPNIQRQVINPNNIQVSSLPNYNIAIQPNSNNPQQSYVVFNNNAINPGYINYSLPQQQYILLYNNNNCNNNALYGQSTTNMNTNMNNNMNDNQNQGLDLKNNNVNPSDRQQL